MQKVAIVVIGFIAVCVVLNVITPELYIALIHTGQDLLTWLGSAFQRNGGAT